MKKAMLACAMMALLVAAVGCVTPWGYHELRNDYDAQIKINEELESKITSLGPDNDKLRRQVKELASGWQEAGRHSLNWDGKDKMGRTCPSGVYFCSLKTEHQKDVKKMLIAE